MLLSYVKLSLRLLARNPFMTLINALGLSVGFAAFFILWHHSTSELKTDQHHSDFDKIVRIGIYYGWRDYSSTGRMTSGALRSYQPPLIANDFHQVKDFVRFLQQPQFNTGLVGHSDEIVISLTDDGTRKFFGEDQMVYADPNLFSFFTIPLRLGTPEDVLTQAGSVVISESRANQFFGDRNPLGEVVMVNDTIELMVTGVFQDLPHTTHLSFDMVASNVGLAAAWDARYALASGYFKFHQAASIPEFAREIAAHGAKRYFLTQDVTRPDMVGYTLEMFVQRLTDIAFREPYEFDFRPKPKSKFILRTLQIVSALILLMAWINYINLGIPRLLKRMKEVATRKVAGAFSADFAKQFLVESCLINTVALMMAFTMMQLIRFPALEFLDVQVPEFGAMSLGTWYVFVLAALVGILIMGLYPAVMSSSFTSWGLFGFSRASSGGRTIQSVLTVCQYSTALVLILCAFSTYLQLNYILHKELGIRKEEVVILNSPVVTTSTYLSDFDFFMNQVRATPGVLDATSSFSVVGDLQSSILTAGPVMAVVGMDTNGGVDENFIPFYGIRLLAGRNFNANDREEAVIVSRYGAEKFGLRNPEDAVGLEGQTYTVLQQGEPKPITIVGVIEDYRFRPYVNVGATSTEGVTGRGVCLAYKNYLVPWFQPKKVSLRIEMSRLKDALSGIEKNFVTAFPRNIFKWYFLNDHINKAYSNEKVTRNQIVFFAGIAIAISCLGLLGMMTLQAEEKTKEIGIRKSLGAGTWAIGRELMKNAIRQVSLAIVLALPVAWYLTNHYLDRYIDRINLQWWHFGAPVIMLLALMFATISSILIKAIRTNPVESLRYE